MELDRYKMVPVVQELRLLLGGADHARSEQNNIDPDDGNSWLCSVCGLPIFSTPFIESNTDDDQYSSEVTYMHDQCANLPTVLKDSDFHPRNTLLLRKKKGFWSRSMSYWCNICNRNFWVLDVFTIKILHRSHRHRLMAIRGGSVSFICNICGKRRHEHDQAVSALMKTKKEIMVDRYQPSWDLFYMCNACCFWIHPLCASLPNIIVQLTHSKHQHHHPLLLNYRYGPNSSMPDRDSCYCAICEGIIESLGVYSCTKCRYYAHIMCAVSDPPAFKPVSIREAQLPDLVYLPIANELTSAMRSITASTSSSSDHDTASHDHEHELIFRGDNDDDDDGRRVCNACAQFITPPFYGCPECPDFFLHDCCAHLPRTLTQHPAHDHSLSLVPKAPSSSKSFLSIFHCRCCRQPCNGFAYTCTTCNNFDMDVLCALTPASITHHAHSKTHILYPKFVEFGSVRYSGDKNSDCCGGTVEGLFYVCRTCHNFRIHARCALLPDTVSHRFDPHPLKLITTTTARHRFDPDFRELMTATTSQSSQQVVMQQQFCEICEEDFGNRRWYYSCDECDKWFHNDCIPCFDPLSKIKFGVTNIILVECHGCPLTLIRALTVHGSRCGYCGGSFMKYEALALECSKCYFRIHGECAENVMKKDLDNKFTGAGRGGAEEY